MPKRNEFELKRTYEFKLNGHSTKIIFRPETEVDRKRISSGPSTLTRDLQTPSRSSRNTTVENRSKIRPRPFRRVKNRLFTSPPEAEVVFPSSWYRSTASKLGPNKRYQDRSNRLGTSWEMMPKRNEFELKRTYEFKLNGHSTKIIFRPETEVDRKRISSGPSTLTRDLQTPSRSSRNTTVENRSKIRPRPFRRVKNRLFTSPPEAEVVFPSSWYRSTASKLGPNKRYQDRSNRLGTSWEMMPKRNEFELKRTYEFKLNGHSTKIIFRPETEVDRKRISSGPSTLTRDLQTPSRSSRNTTVENRSKIRPRPFRRVKNRLFTSPPEAEVVFPSSWYRSTASKLGPNKRYQDRSNRLGTSWEMMPKRNEFELKRTYEFKLNGHSTKIIFRPETEVDRKRISSGPSTLTRDLQTPSRSSRNTTVENRSKIRPRPFRRVKNRLFTSPPEAEVVFPSSWYRSTASKLGPNKRYQDR